jgi:hypothetical protein
MPGVLRGLAADVVATDSGPVLRRAPGPPARRPGVEGAGGLEGLQETTTGDVALTVWDVPTSQTDTVTV